MVEFPTPTKLMETIVKEKAVEGEKKNIVILIGNYSDSSLMTIRKCLQEVDSKLNAYKADDIGSEDWITPRQKLHALLSVCNFVIAEDSVPCGEMLELEYCRHTGAITAIMHTGQRSSFMTLDCDLHSPDFEVFNYNPKNFEETKKTIKQVLEWVEKTKKRRTDEMQKWTKELAYTRYCAKENCKERLKNPN